MKSVIVGNPEPDTLNGFFSLCSAKFFFYVKDMYW